MVKNWTDGDYVYSADMDRLELGTSMVFSSMSNLTSTLVGDLAPQQGMRAFTTDTQQAWQYVVVSTIGYWAPMPGALICEAYTAGTQSIPNSTMTAVTGFTSIRNMSTWLTLATGRFTPKVPGYYEMTGSVYYTFNATGARQVGWRKNASANLEHASAAAAQATSSGNATYFARTCAIYMNGTTDYVELATTQTSGAALDIIPGGAQGYSAAIMATYKGL